MTAGPPAASDAHRVRLVGDPVSVPVARGIVRGALLAWSEAELLDAALLVTSELATNATLHSDAGFFTLEIGRPAPGSVVVAVTDAGAIPTEAVQPRPAELAEGSDELTTGRGLALVAELAQAWGVQTTTSGKRVWAALGEVAGLATPPMTVPRQSRPAPAPPPGWHVVRLVDCPVALSLRQDDHLDELVRDLQLAAPAGRDAPPGEQLSAQMRGVLLKHAHARHMGRRTAQQGASAGLEHVTVEMSVPAAAADDVVQLHAVVTAADALAARGRLLIEPSPPELTALREWMASEFTRQIHRGLPPTPYATWLDINTVTAAAGG